MNDPRAISPLAENNYRCCNSRRSNNESILSEYLKLVEVAGRLETYLSNRNAPRRSFKERFGQHIEVDDEIESVKEEAQLLMSLMTSFPRNKAHQEDKSTDYTNSIANNNNTGFSFRCPSLSLKHGSNSNNSAAPDLLSSSQQEAMELQAKCPGPPQLFARPLVTAAWDDIKQVAETMAANTMQSFIAALEWRAREWVKTLAKFLYLKRKPVQGIQQQSPEDEQSFCRAIAATKEALVIESIALAAQNIVVRDIRATVNVLERQVDTTASPPKKRKLRNDNYSSQKSYLKDSYKVSHAVSLNLRLTVSTDPQGSIVNVDLAVPGVIHGIFIRNNGEVQLIETDVNVDTEALAMAIEKNSRLVLRTVAEAHLSSSTVISSSSQGEEDINAEELDEHHNVEDSNDHATEKHTHTPDCDVQARYPTAVLVTPRQCNASPISNSSSDNEGMHPPPSRIAILEDELFFNQQNKYQTMNRVSPTLHQQVFDQSITSPTPVTSTGIPSCTMLQSQTNHMLIPSLVSPHPSTNTEDKSSDLHALKLRYLHGRGPSLPALVEVACAAINAP
eukprot:CAMPEP_0197832654 /NCGR_PEP_ID=MMETSP1437-20131217/15395_1 /TAXON_ID=49252 ORGANISM="Eucampia antarctica, Strain CCMP1452" /NCGR_SAMPLE_ID=MMETSP1437 /ASSEMBLY_ACC=CAM_ASM_001096 /LENGTH=561 /DNA_ID=CAMNT_0043436119 /DNA_START=147 /DNA_END=1832 /DNA_ORIENTATION=+